MGYLVTKEVKGMDPGNIVRIIERRHPLHGCRGIVVGRRGNYRENDPFLLVVIQSRNVSVLVPQSMVEIEPDDTAPIDTN
jgi:hypothetical protein